MFKSVPASCNLHCYLLSKLRKHIALYHHILTLPLQTESFLKMKSLPLLLLSLLAATASTAPVNINNAEIKRDVDVTIDGKPYNIEGGYIRGADLDRMGYSIEDQVGSKKRGELDVDGVATRSGWGYIKAREEEKRGDLDVDGVATRSGCSVGIHQSS